MVEFDTRLTPNSYSQIECNRDSCTEARPKVNIQINGRAATILEAQVAAGNFATVEEAIEAAVLALTGAGDNDLTWAKPSIAAADREIAAGQTLSEDEAFAGLEQLYGKL